ncbi:MAG: hypothetical protein NUV67_01230 [archaeon]|nr:hypothetical protein [archaeon]
MERGEKVILAALIAGALFTVLVLILAAIFFAPSAKVSEEPSSRDSAVQGPYLVPKDVPANDSNAQVREDSVSAASLWGKITLGAVEGACLSAAKQQAGSNAWAVSSCSCSETSPGSEKHYSCSVFALDGAHPVQIDCYVSSGSCRIESEAGVAVYSLERLAEIVEN